MSHGRLPHMRERSRDRSKGTLLHHRQLASRANGARNSPPDLDVALLRLGLTILHTHGTGGRRLRHHKMRTSVVVLVLALGCLAVAEAAGAHYHAQRA